MSSEIKERLKTSSEACIQCYEAWDGNEKDGKAREALQDAIHELRKVASRLEIDLAISERDQLTQKPIPIPPHRDSRRPRAGGASKSSDGDEHNNNHKPKSQSQVAQENGGPKVEIQKRPRRAKPAASSEE